MSSSQETPRVVITGIGHVVHPAFEQALTGQLASAPDPAPEITGFEIPEEAPAFGFEILDFEIEKVLPNIKTFVDRTSAFALAAAKAALMDAALLETDARAGHDDIGCGYGTTMGCLEAMDIFWQKLKKGNPKFAPPLPFTHSYTNSPSSLMCIEFGLKGAAATFSGETLVGLEALLFALEQIRTGCAERVVVCASESLSERLHAHFRALGRLSASGQLKPWATGNDGIVPGEGGVALLLESLSSARSRGRTPYAELNDVALGACSKQDSLSEAWESSWGQAWSRLEVPAQPTYLCACASGDDLSGMAEQRFFEARFPELQRLRVLSTKPFTGDLLSASPLLDLALCARLLGQAPSCEKSAGLFQLKSGVKNGEESIRSAMICALDPQGLTGIASLYSARLKSQVSA